MQPKIEIQHTNTLCVAYRNPKRLKKREKSEAVRNARSYCLSLMTDEYLAFLDKNRVVVIGLGEFNI